jgi:hypothetical protein
MSRTMRVKDSGRSGSGGVRELSEPTATRCLRTPSDAGSGSGPAAAADRRQVGDSSALRRGAGENPVEMRDGLPAAALAEEPNPCPPLPNTAVWGDYRGLAVHGSHRSPSTHRRLVPVHRSSRAFPDPRPLLASPRSASAACPGPNAPYPTARPHFSTAPSSAVFSVLFSKEMRMMVRRPRAALSLASRGAPRYNPDQQPAGSFSLSIATT